MNYSHFTAPPLETLDQEIDRLVAMRVEHERQAVAIQKEVDILLQLKIAALEQKKAGL